MLFFIDVKIYKKCENSNIYFYKALNYNQTK